MLAFIFHCNPLKSMSFAGVAHSSVTYSSSRALVPSVVSDCHAYEQGMGVAPRKKTYASCVRPWHPSFAQGTGRGRKGREA